MNDLIKQRFSFVVYINKQYGASSVSLVKQHTQCGRHGQCCSQQGHYHGLISGGSYVQHLLHPLKLYEEYICIRKKATQSLGMSVLYYVHGTDPDVSHLMSLCQLHVMLCCLLKWSSQRRSKKVNTELSCSG